MKKNVVFLILSAIVLIVVAVFLFKKPKNSADFELTPPVVEETAADDFPVMENNPPAVVKAAFDIVRVEEDGTMVAAGKGAVDEEISLMDGDSVLAVVKINADGEWVYVPETPLSAGEHELWLRDSSDNARNESEVVVVTVPERVNGAEALAVLMSPDAEDITILQAPEPVEALIDIQSVNYADGSFKIAGNVREAGKINVYVNNSFAGSTRVGKAGKWTLKTAHAVKAGMKYTIRADKTDENGQVSARIEVPFEIETGMDADNVRRVRVVKGDSLWKIAKFVYGRGNAYVTIYRANKKQIKDPNLIYPNQVFVVPARAGK